MQTPWLLYLENQGVHRVNREINETIGGRKRITNIISGLHLRAMSDTLDLNSTKVIVDIKNSTKSIIREAKEIDNQPNKLNTGDERIIKKK